MSASWASDTALTLGRPETGTTGFDGALALAAMAFVTTEGCVEAPSVLRICGRRQFQFRLRSYGLKKCVDVRQLSVGNDYTARWPLARRQSRYAT